MDSVKLTTLSDKQCVCVEL